MLSLGVLVCTFSRASSPLVISSGSDPEGSSMDNTYTILFMDHGVLR